MPISAGLREDIAAYRGFIGQQYFIIRPLEYRGAVTPIILVSSVCFTDASRRI